MKIQILKTLAGRILYAARHKSICEALEYAIAAGIELDDLNLDAADLRGANLDGMKIKGADFSNTDLTGANLTECTLHDCNFKGARLVDTCFCYSDMISCNFADAEFGATDLSEARLDYSKFSAQACSTLNLEEAHSLKNLSLTTDHGIQTISRPPIVIKSGKNRILCLNDLYFGNKIMKLIPSGYGENKIIELS